MGERERDWRGVKRRVYPIDNSPPDVEELIEWDGVLRGELGGTGVCGGSIRK